ncbi:hypothetical protein CXB38_16985 [Pseudomonas syringae]|uniref:hypothetical protein n=1 Tax=Pseudomonas syringae TaxID=317 RepID=UPI000CDACF80|nr:hypothetical protein [Pseudomonas syringae]POP80615.1 hypothetical protein CXB38_16985 [Pseudomonas syringae]
MDEWFESLDQCVKDGVVELKTTFEIVTNFSFIRAKAFLALSEGAPNFSYDEHLGTLFNFDLEDAELGSGIQVHSVELDEELHSEGLYTVEILFNYEVSKELVALEHTRATLKLVKLNTRLVDFLKVSLTLAGREFTVVPSTLNLRIQTPHGWRRVSQSSGEQPKIEPLQAEAFDGFLKSLQSSTKVFARYTMEKKIKNLVGLMSSGLRLETQNFESDALLNFYKVIEVVAKDPAFVEHSVEILERPLAYGKAIVNSGQRSLIAYVWEYLKKIEPEIGEDSLELLVNIADTRNKLAHVGAAKLEPNMVPFCKTVAMVLLRKFLVLKTTSDKT